ncbi:GDSL-type esterase/lipase family protein [Actinokineospora sp. PR83]|uniref:GDSL-type esterase/lipase family protein n=1 Tax=Actinokineospora sp. PR83 TaxID=2884908 RepID=UPI0027DFEFD1|nr:GDSL-type esterase/lipase family protein [Actinokineospora sp. PR83]MCG8920756.1 GDSL-type esterase/lipase family protein [Actinokineospora sp. PR83]
MSVRLFAAASAALFALSGCAATSTAADPGERYYVSVGDSYAAGYKPTGADGGGTSTDGFAYQVAEKTVVHGVPMRLANFGCSGVTTAQLRAEPGCAPVALAPGAPDYGGLSQARAAVKFMSENRGRVGLVTVVVGGNDVRPCLPIGATPRPDAIDCVTASVERLRTDLAAVLAELRAAAGPDVPIVGVSYPDMLLGYWVTAGAPGRDVAAASVGVFRDLVNPVLRAEYAKVGAEFVDVTEAAQGYVPLTQTTSVPGYGTVPTAVAGACLYTYFCQYGDVHPTADGHRLIAEHVVRAAHIA